MNGQKNIVIKLKGGLGNQMFQYAFARALKHSAEKVGFSINLSYDATAYTEGRRVKQDTIRTFDLERLYCDVPVADEYSVLKLRNPYGLLSKISRKLVEKYLLPDTVSFNPSLLEPPFKKYYEGYWQSPKYFTEIEDEIRQAFRFREQLGTVASARLQEIDTEPNAVSVFYRKTDYIGHSDFDTCDESYYERAFAKMKELVPNAKFFVTSDDMEWVRKNAKLPQNSVLVSDKATINYVEEMKIISHCKHFIIPNSSFGWWTAWLSPHYKTANIIAPALWSKKHNLTQFKDITPAHWLRV
jgi:hypothetical protein